MYATVHKTLGKKVRKDKELKFYKVMAPLVLMYGSESWTPTQNQRKRIEAAEMKFLRRVSKNAP